LARPDERRLQPLKGYEREIISLKCVLLFRQRHPSKGGCGWKGIMPG
jgi:hypothetical protein